MLMVKSQTFFVCQECGYETTSWLGKCPECGVWNSLKEFHIAKERGAKARQGNLVVTNLKPQILSEINLEDKNRILSGFSEMDNVMGGGIVPGSITLLAGDPGIGKSTLLLQIALKIAGSQIASGSEAKNENKKVLYISGEESVEQIKLRASRIENALENKNLLLFSSTSVEIAVNLIEQEKPSLVVIDSVQTMESNLLEGMSGSVGQIRFITSVFMKTAKTLGIPIVLVGHVTKEGMVAGPMVLSHMVDTVLFLEGEKFTNTRLLRSLKNRFGPVDEVGVFSMESSGMTDVKNPEQLFLTQRDNQVAGSVLTVILEGTRPFLIELQALVVYSKFPMPRRVANGVDQKRLELLLAVLQKQCNLNLESYDVYINIAGGLRVTDRAVDLGICLAIFSSLKNITLSSSVAISEVGLLGELRNIGSLEKRIKEAKKLGFKQIITSLDFRNLRDVINSFGGVKPSEKQFKQIDPRHFTIDNEN